jgi:ATP synthase protein I
MNTPDSDPIERDPMLRSVQVHSERERRWREEGEQGVARRLAQIGVLGWIVVTPILIGVFTGRWLDRTLHSGLFCTAPLLMLGAVLGCWSAWRWMQRA